MSTQTLVIEVSVENVDPSLVDPHEVAEEILYPYEAERLAGNTGRFEIGESFLSAEWSS